MFSVLPGVQQEEVEKQPDEVSTRHVNTSVPYHLNSGTSVRKRLTTNNSNKTKCALLYTKSRTLSESTPSGSESETKPKVTSKKYKIYPFKNRSAEEFRKKSSSIDSSDCEVDVGYYHKHKKHETTKNEEKSQLLYYKDNKKYFKYNKESKVTKYSTFDLKSDEKRKIIKYQSLDESIIQTKYQDTQVRYKDTRSNVSLSAQEFDVNFKLSKVNKKPKRDLITSTVDSWAKRGTKNMFSNIKNSLFKHSSDKAVIFKPLIFGGTFPIDLPMSTSESDKRNLERYRGGGGGDENRVKDNHKLLLADLPQIREYGAPKTFDIDRPI